MDALELVSVETDNRGSFVARGLCRPGVVCNNRSSFFEGMVEKATFFMIKYK